MTRLQLRRSAVCLLAGALSCACGEDFAASTPSADGALDLAELPHLRIYGAPGTGERGTPIAGGKDIDGDGHADYLIASFLGTPPPRAGLTRTSAGIVAIAFGDGELTGELDASVPGHRVVHVHGENIAEMAGNEVWLDDVTGDGLADVLIGRQNFTPDPQGGEYPGAISIVVGGAALRELAGGVLELGESGAVRVTTLVGDADGDRLGIWFRSGDIDSDGIADLLIGADQVSRGTSSHQGAAYALRGGGGLAAGGTRRLSEIEASEFAELTAGIPAESHFGATCQLADLDADGRTEAIVAATIERAGAGVPPDGAHAKTTHPNGGVEHGGVWIFSGSAIASAWSSGARAVGAAGSLLGEERNVRFGEEIVGLGDLDGDGSADLFLGDIIGNGAGDTLRPRAGSGHVVFSAAQLLSGDHELTDLRAAGSLFEVLGAAAGDITGDTAVGGDFDGDGVFDLAVASPHASRGGRRLAGMVHLIHGGAGLPEFLDLADPKRSSQLRLVELLGAHGDDALGQGDILSYSAASADLDGDGTTDLMLNEMTGDGPAGVDTGNLVVISGRALRSEP